MGKSARFSRPPAAHPRFDALPEGVANIVALNLGEASVLARPGILLDSALGTFDVENVLKERMHVQPEETRCRGVRRSP
jgi:hypothetical protein